MSFFNNIRVFVIIEILVLITTSIAAFTQTNTSNTIDGFQVGFNQYHNHKSSTVLGPSQPKVLWKQKLVNSPSSAAVDADNNIYIANDAKLYCFNANGSFKWSMLLSAKIRQISTSNTNRVVLVGTIDDKLHCISFQGKLVWNRKEIISFVHTSKSIIVISEGTTQKSIQCLNYWGKNQWIGKLPLRVTAPPAIGYDNRIYAISTDGQLIAYGEAGIGLWKKALDKIKNITFENPPAIGSDNTIYVASNHYYLYAVKPDGSLLWKFTADGRITGGVAIGANDNLYITGLFPKVIALDKFGKVLWKSRTNGFVFSPPVLDAHDNLYFMTIQDTIISLDNTGAQRWSLFVKFPPSSVLSPNFLSNKTLIIGNVALGD